MPCGCCGHGFCCGHLMYMLEKIAAFCAMSAIISCIVITVLISIGVGVGIGYNYCFVDTKTLRMTALENLRNSRNRLELPNSPNLFPPQASNADSENLRSNNVTTTTFSSITTTTTSSASTSKNKSFLRITDLPNFPNVPNIPSIPFGKKNNTRGGGNTSTTDILKKPDVSKSYPNMKMSPGFALGIPDLTGVMKYGSDLGYSAVQESPPIFFDEQGEHTIPHSPNFPESFRRVPVINNKVKLAASVQSGDRENSRKYKTGPVNVGRRQAFEFRKAVEVNTKSLGKKASSSDFTDAVTEGTDLDQRKIKYVRRKPAERKNKKTGTASTIMPTIIIPFKKYANMSPLISKILAQNKNVTLQFITL